MVFEIAAPEDEALAAQFVALEYPEWLPYFSQAFRAGRAGEVILARSGGEILGACLAESGAALWSARFVNPVGAPACILTAERAPERGIGLALSAFATEQLQARGCRTSFIGWTWLVDWYGKLGYRVWAENIMSWRGREAVDED